jgi:hypothetical protein
MKPKTMKPKTMKIHILFLLFLTVASTAFSQTLYYRDNNGTTAGFGALSGNWDTSTSAWTTSSAGDIATTTWVNNVGTPNDATLDFVGNSAGAPTIGLSADLNLRNLEIKGLGNMTGTAGPVLGATASRTLTFGSGATVTVEDRAAFTYDFYIRQFNNASGTNTLNVNGFTKAGAGTMLIAAQAQTTEGANAVVKVTGTVNVNAGQISLATFGTTTDTSRSVDVGDATFSLSSGTVLSAATPLSYTGTQPINGTAALGIVTGNGTIRGERQGATNTLTITAKGLTPGTYGTTGTLIIEDFTGTNTLGQEANAATSFSFADTQVGGLKFDLAATGVSDQITLSGLTTVDASALTFDRFDFNTLSGFANGNNYTLMSLTGAGSWSGFSTVTGTVGGLDATISLSGNDLVLSVVPEPSTWALLAGGLTTVMLLRRLRASSLR